jgi:hypothetical protein
MYSGEKKKLSMGITDKKDLESWFTQEFSSSQMEIGWRAVS